MGTPTASIKLAVHMEQRNRISDRSSNETKGEGVLIFLKYGTSYSFLYANAMIQ